MKKYFIMAVVVVMSVILMVNASFADYYTDKTILKYGTRSPNVTSLQTDLKKLGYFSYNTTGYFGSITRQSVIKFQTDNRLQVDGIVGPVTARQLKVSRFIQISKGYLGVPYVWGGTSPSGFDCSGFVHYSLLQIGVTIPRTTNAQYSQGIPVQKGSLKAGDLVFFTTYKPGPSHVGVYLGGGKFIHASSGAGKVIVSDMSNSYYSSRYIGARRIIN